MRREAGFSLLEILLVVGVVGVLTAITVPMIAGAMDRYEVTSASQQVASTIRTARLQAVARNRNTRVRFDFPAAGQYQTEVQDPGWTPLGAVQLLPPDVSFGAAATVQFGPNGRLVGAAAAITLTNGNAGSDRTINVTASGRIELQ